MRGDDAGGYADGSGVGGDVAIDDGIGTDLDMTTDLNGANDFGTGPDKDMISEGGRLAAFGSDGYEVFDVDIAACPNGTIDDDPIAVDEHEAGAELGTAPDDAAAEESIQFIEEHGERCETIMV